MTDVRNVIEQASLLVDGFIYDHRAAAIPALIGACVLWAVEHGGADVVKGSLRNAIKMADDMNHERLKHG